MASPLRSDIADKRCRKCGSDLLHRPRVKDHRGRYYCKPCYETALAAKREKAAAAQRNLQKAATTSADELPTAEPEAVAEILPDDGDVSRYDPLLDVESSAVLPAPVTCPSCGRGLATDAVICTSCGYDRRTGQRIGVSSAPPTEPQPLRAGRAAIARKQGSGADSGGAPFWQTAWFFGVASLVFFVGFYVAASRNTALAAAFQITQTIYSLAVSIWLLVVAFQESAAQGCLCLFTCGFYSLYYVFLRQENVHLKFAMGVSIVSAVLGAMLGGQMLFALLSQQQGGT